MDTGLADLIKQINEQGEGLANEAKELGSSLGGLGSKMATKKKAKKSNKVDRNELQEMEDELEDDDLEDEDLEDLGDEDLEDEVPEPPRKKLKRVPKFRTKRQNDESKALNPSESLEQQVMLLQNDGLFRLQLLLELQKLNTSLEKLNEVVASWEMQ